MIQLERIRNEEKEISTSLLKRGHDFSSEISEIKQLDIERRAKQSELDQLLSQLNNGSKAIGQLITEGKSSEVDSLKQEMADLRDTCKLKEEALNELLDKIQKLLLSIPNVPHARVPEGNSENHNVETERVGNIPDLPEGALPHWELTKKYNLIDFDLGTKITGAGFPVYLGKGAKLQRALVSFFLDRNIAAGYNEYQPPLLVNEASGYGTGQLPDKDSQMYHVGIDDLYLIPTAEVPITNMFRDTIVNEDVLPIKCTSYTPCFRREAGSYGAHVRGLNRLHQFDKVEIVEVAHPEHSYERFEAMEKHISSILKDLEIPYRKLLLCGGDLGFASAITLDFESYSAAQKKWLEVSSLSNFETYQTTRLKLRIKNAQGGKQLAHTLNGSSLALPRIIATLLENNQTSEGIKIPKALVPYTGFDTIN